MELLTRMVGIAFVLIGLDVFVYEGLALAWLRVGMVMVALSIDAVDR